MKILFTCKEIPLCSKEVLAGFDTQISSHSHLIDTKCWYAEIPVLVITEVAICLYAEEF